MQVLKKKSTKSVQHTQINKITKLTERQRLLLYVLVIARYKHNIKLTKNAVRAIVFFLNKNGVYLSKKYHFIMYSRGAYCDELEKDLQNIVFWDFLIYNNKGYYSNVKNIDTKKQKKRDHEISRFVNIIKLINTKKDRMLSEKESQDNMELLVLCLCCASALEIEGARPVNPKTVYMQVFSWARNRFDKQRVQKMCFILGIKFGIKHKVINGCTGIPWITSFEDCCNQHDIAYSESDNRAEADWVLYKCIKAKNKHITACFVWLCTRLFGWYFYKRK